MQTEYVLDASAAGKLVAVEPESETLHAWLRQERSLAASFAVPEVFPWELRNIAAKALKRGELSDAQAAAAACERFGTIVTATDTDAPKTIELAVRHGLTTHDAAYVSLMEGGRVLVTYDDRMAKVGRLLHGKDRVLSPR